MKTAGLVGIAAVAAMCMAHPALGQDKPGQMQVVLPADGKASSFKGTIRGYDSVDYVFQAQAGRKLRIDLKTQHRSAYFNLLQDGKDEALFVGPLSGNTFDAALPDTATYRVRVYLMRNAARKNAKARYELQLRRAPLRPDAT